MVCTPLLPHRIAALTLACVIAMPASPSATAFAVETTTTSPAATSTTFTFEGGGYGHGIGLSQYGAKGFAEQGKKYDWILAHFYQGTRLKTKSSVTVRVNLDSGSDPRSSWWISSADDTTLTVKPESGDASEAVNIDAGKSVWIVGIAGGAKVCKDETYQVDGTTRHRPGDKIASFDDEVIATAGGLVKMRGSSGPFNHTGVAWRGTIRFRPSSSTSAKLKAINYVGIEEYLKGVVPRESPSSWHLEALKAQAVAARSYAYQDGVDKNTLHCTTRSQVYNGYKGPKGGETTRTNSAVEQTKGQLVWYGSESKPVKTYFSASSGGHTANIEDVWLGATPKPYYKGVEDADEPGNPHYRWSVGPYSGATMATKLRAQGSGVSEPSPAIVTDVRCDRAASGHSRNVTFEWSNGRSHTLRGDSVRRAFGLRSTHFSVNVKRPNTTNSFEQSDGHFAWFGVWKTESPSGCSGGSLRSSSTTDSEFIARFSGTAVKWIGEKGPKSGRAEVTLDGKSLGTYDLYAAKTDQKATLLSKKGLSSGTHRLSIRVTGKKSSSSKGRRVTVDRIDVTGGSLSDADTPEMRYEDTSAKVLALGGWTRAKDASFSGGSHLYTATKKATVRLRFTGTGLRWIGSRGPNYGAATVSVDGSNPETVTLTAEKTVRQKVVWDVSGLDRSKTHTVLITALGAGSGGAKGYTSLDRVEVVGGWCVVPDMPTASIEQNSATVRYVGGWSTVENSKASGGSYAVGKSSGSNVSIAFDGTGIRWTGVTGPSYGRAEVWLDGKKAATVNCFSKTTSFKHVMFASRGLTLGRHSLTIKVLATKEQSASGTNVSVDTFDIDGAVLP